MIDKHSHILPEIDDGCRNFEDSIKALQEIESKGIKKIILTPHYIKGSSFACNNKEKKKLLEELQKQIKEKNIKVELYLGNEIYVDNDLEGLIKNDEVMTLNNSKYILFELPMNNVVNNLKEVIFDLRSRGFVPILAHPERYFYYQNNSEELISLIEQGCLLQGNLGSLIGLYGKRSKKCLKKLLMHNLIHFMATDVHHSNSKIYILLDEAIAALKIIMGEEETKKLIIENPQKVINNQEIKITKPKEFKSFLKFF